MMMTPSIYVDQSIFRYLDTVGDGSGIKNAMGDYSGAVEEFLYIAGGPAATGRVDLHRLVIFVRDSGLFTADSYGALAALTNGIEIEVRDSDDNILVDLTDGVPVKSNAQWCRVCYDSILQDYGAAGDSYVVTRWTFTRSGSPLALKAGDRLVVKLNDDLTGLIDHTFMIQGIQRAEAPAWS